MKKFIVLLAALAIAAPSFGGSVEFTATPGPGECTISWVATGTNPVAMGLDIDCDQPVTSSVLAVDSFFDIFMDAAYDMENTTPGSYTYGAGGPVAAQDVRGLTTDDQSFCMSMGGLGGATTPLDPAPATGSFKLTAAAAAAGTINVNVLRGGIIDTAGDPMTHNLELAFTILDDCTGCIPCDHPDRALWEYLGSPECWCVPYHDQGNTNTTFAGLDVDGKRKWVELTDLQKLGEGWMLRKMDYVTDEICADFNRAFAGLDVDSKRKWIELGDLQELGTAWMDRAMDLPADTYLVAPGYIVVDRTTE